MKRISIITILMLLLTAIGARTLRAQEKNDVVVMLNGDRNEGKVVGISNNIVKFTFKGEDLVYEFETDKISRIEFASGRVQQFAKASSVAGAVSPAAGSSPADRNNKIAILPFDYVTNDTTVPVESMHTAVQDACANSFRHNAPALSVQDTRTTNAILAQNNIKFEILNTMAPKDLAIMLGVQYLVFGVYDLQYKGTVTTGTGVTTYKDKDSQKKDDGNKNSKSSGTAVTSNTTTTQASYDSRVDLSIYNDQGNNVFKESRKPFTAGVESYTSAIDYLVKRTPFGSKAKK